MSTASTNYNTTPEEAQVLVDEETNKTKTHACTPISIGVNLEQKTTNTLKQCSVQLCFVRSFNIKARAVGMATALNTSIARRNQRYRRLLGDQ